MTAQVVSHGNISETLVLAKFNLFYKRESFVVMKDFVLGPRGLHLYPKNK